jgi:hypothetical protein
MHVFEPAASGRSKCRGCGRALAKGELRFGERLPNPFGEGEMTLWFHPDCAAYKRPDAIIEALAQPAGESSNPEERGHATAEIPNREALERIARRGASQKRLARIDGVERAKGQAACRHCREPIPKGAWRIRLVFFDEGQFAASGFIHVDCRAAYFETGDDILEQVLHFSPALEDPDREELRALFPRSPAAGA